MGGWSVPEKAKAAVAAVATAVLLTKMAQAPRAVQGGVPAKALVASAPGGLLVVPWEAARRWWAWGPCAPTSRLCR